MTFRNRYNDDLTSVRPTIAAALPINPLQSAIDRLMSIADRLVDAGISNDSATFNRSTTQATGE